MKERLKVKTTSRSKSFQTEVKLFKSKINLKTPLVYLITEGKITSENFDEESKRTLEIVKEAAIAGVSLIQIREKRLPARLLFQLTTEAIKVVQAIEADVKILVNERADIAFAAQAHGVHLPEDSIPVRVIRKIFPEDFIIGVSCHDIQACTDSANSGADFVTFSPIFPTPGKDKPKGLEALREVCEKLKPFPVIALGGINQENYKETLEIASGFAAIRFLNDKNNLKQLSEILAR